MNLASIAVPAFALVALGGPSGYPDASTGLDVSFEFFEGVYGRAIQDDHTASTASATSAFEQAMAGARTADPPKDGGFKQVSFLPQQATGRPEPSFVDAPLMVVLSGREIVRATVSRLNTEDLMEEVGETFEAFIDDNGTFGIKALLATLHGSSIDSDFAEPLWWRFLRALGKHRDATTDHTARGILISQINSPSGGRRSAAAAGLGGFRDASALAALKRRAEVERNRFVHATLEAHIRSIRRTNGLSSEATT
jgi:hypothetical protein